LFVDGGDGLGVPDVDEGAAAAQAAGALAEDSGGIVDQGGGLVDVAVAVDHRAGAAGVPVEELAGVDGGRCADLLGGALAGGAFGDADGLAGVGLEGADAEGAAETADVVGQLGGGGELEAAGGDVVGDGAEQVGRRALGEAGGGVVEADDGVNVELGELSDLAALGDGLLA
jgi:hypothetical protein